MKNVGKLVVMLSLVAMAPSYAAQSKKADVAKKITKTMDGSHFKGLEHRFVFVNNENCGNGDGSWAHPFPTLQDAQEFSLPGQCIYVIATDDPYTTDPYSGQDVVITLQASQCLISSCCSIKLDGKTIPALTPGKHAKIQLLNGEVGVLMTNCNQVSCFEFIGPDPLNAKDNTPPIGISSVPNGVGGNSTISKNIFKQLGFDINIFVQSSSHLNICENHFCNDGLDSILAYGDDLAEVHIDKNTFEGSPEEAFINFEPQFYTKKNQAEKKQVKALKEASLSSSDAPKLFVNENKFDGTGSYSGTNMLLSSGTSYVELCKNHVSGNIFEGFKIRQYSPIKSAVRIEGNSIETNVVGNELYLTNVKATVEHNVFNGGKTALNIRAEGVGVEAFVKKNIFKGEIGYGLICVNCEELDFCENHILGALAAGIEVQSFLAPKSIVRIVKNTINLDSSVSNLTSGPINLLRLRDTKATVEHNKFNHGSQGLYIKSEGNVTACVEHNKFEHQSAVGFEMETSNPEGGSSCLKLVKNEAKHISSGTGYILKNVTLDDTLFEVAVPNPSGDLQTQLENRNQGSVVLEGEPYSYGDSFTAVRHCAGCAHSE